VQFVSSMTEFKATYWARLNLGGGCPSCISTSISDTISAKGETACVLYEVEPFKGEGCYSLGRAVSPSDKSSRFACSCNRNWQLQVLLCAMQPV